MEGEYTEDSILEVVAMGQPPCEDRETARYILVYICRRACSPVIDQSMVTSTSWAKVQLLYSKMCVILTSLYGPRLTKLQSQFARRVREELSDLYFFFLSDVWLDNPQTLVGLQKMFDNCIENSFIPKVIVMCGNFTSKSIMQGGGRDIQRYQGV